MSPDTAACATEAGDSRNAEAGKVVPHPGAPGAQRFRLLTPEKLAALPPPNWLLPNMLAARSFGVLYGPPGVGKSFVALDIALSIATGAGGIAPPSMRGPVVYVAAEGSGGLANRIAAWSCHSGCAKVEGVHFLVEAVNLLEPAEVQALTAAVRALQALPVLVIIDTMARCFVGGEENSSKDVGRLVDSVARVQRELECAVLLVHHGTKNDARIERGSSALRGAADTMLYLDKRGRAALLLSCEKQKDAVHFPDQHLTLEVLRLPAGGTSCVIRRDSATDSSSPGLTDYETAFQRILEEAPVGLLHHELQERFMEETGRRESTFDRTLRKLLAGRLVEKTESGRYVWRGECQVSEQCHDGV
jgi:hypothetical protein